MSPRYAHAYLDKLVPRDERLSSYPKIVSSSFSTVKFSVLVYCVVLLFKSQYAQNAKCSEKDIETSMKRLYIILLRTTEKGNHPLAMCHV